MSPVGLSVAQCYTQLVEQTVVTAISGVRCRAGGKSNEACTRVAEAAIAKAIAVHSQVESRVALLAAQAAATTSRTVDEIAGQV